ncbi:MAG TPA: metal-dependent hydrolase [Rhizobacter sp.]|nr:metal-dependent hydrolase [Rhizobacter sp.]
MTDLVVRRLLIDLETEIPPRWAGGDAFRTALFNALSMSFPVGEQFFIDSLRAGLKQLSEDQRERYAAEVQGFIGQEATHRRIHALFNAHLDKRGYVNTWEKRIQSRTPIFDEVNARHVVAATAATEHFTAILADWMLRHTQVLDDAEPRLRTMWMWHASEESEHRSTAFDIYQALGGNHEWRIRWFRRVTVTFLSDVTRQTMRNLWHDGALFSFSTWRSAASYLFGKHGLVRCTYPAWRAYFKPDFHPRQQDDALSRDWLRSNAGQFSEVAR